MMISRAAFDPRSPVPARPTRENPLSIAGSMPAGLRQSASTPAFHPHFVGTSAKERRELRRRNPTGSGSGSQLSTSGTASSLGCGAADDWLAYTQHVQRSFVERTQKLQAHNESRGQLSYAGSQRSLRPSASSYLALLRQQ